MSAKRDQWARKTRANLTMLTTISQHDFEFLVAHGLRELLEALTKFDAFARKEIVRLLDPMTPEVEALNGLQQLFNGTIFFVRLLERMGNVALGKTRVQLPALNQRI